MTSDEHSVLLPYLADLEATVRILPRGAWRDSLQVDARLLRCALLLPPARAAPVVALARAG